MKIYKKVTNIYAIFLNKILYTYKKRSKKIKIFYIQLFLSLKKINYPVEGDFIGLDENGNMLLKKIKKTVVEKLINYMD